MNLPSTAMNRPAGCFQDCLRHSYEGPCLRDGWILHSPTQGLKVGELTGDSADYRDADHCHKSGEMGCYNPTPLTPTSCTSSSLMKSIFLTTSKDLISSPGLSDGWNNDTSTSASLAFGYIAQMRAFGGLMRRRAFSPSTRRIGLAVCNNSLSVSRRRKR